VTPPPPGGGGGGVGVQEGAGDSAQRRANPSDALRAADGTHIHRQPEPRVGGRRGPVGAENETDIEKRTNERRAENGNGERVRME